jgi:hypothetical protein
LESGNKVACRLESGEMLNIEFDDHGRFIEGE